MASNKFGVETYELKMSEFVIETTPFVKNSNFVITNYFGSLKRGNQIICEEYIYCKNCLEEKNVFKEYFFY